MIPEMSLSLEIPEMLVRSERVHNRLLKAAMREEVMHHWRKRIPGHFKQTATRKYGYAPRSAKYKKAKERRYGSRTDLVKTGASRDYMTRQARITIGGSGSGGGIHGRLHLRFRFKGGSGRTWRDHRGHGVHIAQMIREVQAFSEDEVQEINKSLGERYARLVETDTTPRQRIKI